MKIKELLVIATAVALLTGCGSSGGGEKPVVNASNLKTYEDEYISFDYDKDAYGIITRNIFINEDGDCSVSYRVDGNMAADTDGIAELRIQLEKGLFSEEDFNDRMHKVDSLPGNVEITPTPDNYYELRGIDESGNPYFSKIITSDSGCQALLSYREFDYGNGVYENDIYQEIYDSFKMSEHLMKDGFTNVQLDGHEGREGVFCRIQLSDEVLESIKKSLSMYDDYMLNKISKDEMFDALNRFETMGTNSDLKYDVEAGRYIGNLATELYWGKYDEAKETCDQLKEFVEQVDEVQ